VDVDELAAPDAGSVEDGTVEEDDVVVVVDVAAVPAATIWLT